MKQGFGPVGDGSLTVIGPGPATAPRAARGACQVLVAATAVLAPQRCCLQMADAPESLLPPHRCRLPPHHWCSQFPDAPTSLLLPHQYLSNATNAGVSPSGFFFPSFFFKRTSVALLKLWEVEDYTDLGTPCPRNLSIT